MNEHMWYKQMSRHWQMMMPGHFNSNFCFLTLITFPQLPLPNSISFLEQKECMHM